MLKTFYGIANRSYNEWNGIFPTLVDAQEYMSDRIQAGCIEGLEIKKITMNKKDLDMCLEGEGTDEVWEQGT